MDDKEFNERYQAWLKTPYRGKLGRPEKDDSNLMKYIIGGAVVAAGAYGLKKFRGAKKLVGLADEAKQTAKAAEGSKVIPKPDLDNDAVARMIVQKAQEAVKTPVKFDLKSEAAKVKLRKTKGSTAPKKAKINKATQGSKPKTVAAPKVTAPPAPKPAPTPAPEAPKAPAPIVQQLEKSGVIEAVRRGSKPKAPKVQGAVPAKATVQETIADVGTDVINKELSLRRKTVAELLKKAKHSTDLDEREKLVASAKEHLSKVEELSNKLPKPSTPPVAEAAPPVVATQKLEPTVVAKGSKRPLSNYEKRQLREQARRLKAGMPPKETDPATDFLKSRGFDESGNPKGKKPPVEIPDEIRQASRGGLDEDELEDMLPGERMKVEKERKASQGGRKMTGIESLIVQRELPPTPKEFDPRHLAKLIIEESKRGGK